MDDDTYRGSMDDATLRPVEELNAPYILMHMKGTPATMNDLCVCSSLSESMV